MTPSLPSLMPPSVPWGLLHCHPRWKGSAQQWIKLPPFFAFDSGGRAALVCGSWLFESEWNASLALYLLSRG